jgi:hypothetical protein
MPTIEVKIDIAQPPEVVAQAFMDPDNAPFWNTDLQRFEVISEEPGVVGSVAHLHYQQGDKTYVMEDVLEEMIPNQYFKSRVSGNGLIAEVETWLKQVEGGTELTMRWCGSASSIPMRILLPLARKSIRRQVIHEVEIFKDLIEKHGAHFSSSP